VITPQESNSDRLERIERMLSGLAEDVAGVKDDVAGVKDDMAGVKDDMAVMKGWQTELAVERRAGQVFARLCDGDLLRIYPDSELRHYIRQARSAGNLSREDAIRAEAIDFLLEGTNAAGAPVIYAVEVSFTAGPDDTERAIAKAELLTLLLGREIKPAVVGASFTVGFAADAALRSVAYARIRNGGSITR
jgi:hypothetical protein